MYSRRLAPELRSLDVVKLLSARTAARTVRAMRGVKTTPMTTIRVARWDVPSAATTVTVEDDEGKGQERVDDPADDVVH